MVRVITAIKLSVLSALVTWLIKEQRTPKPGVLPPPTSGKKLVELIDKYGFTEEDADDLDRVIASHRQKVRE